jgi:hypothetical protein
MSGGSCKSSANDCGTEAFTDPDVAVVLRGSLGDLQRAGDRLEQHGIEAAIVTAPGQNAGAGCCSPSLYLVVAREDAQASFAVFDQDWKRGLTEEQLAAMETSAGIVIDPEAAETTCPACLHTFQTGPAECPDCGLSIG